MPKNLLQLRSRRFYDSRGLEDCNSNKDSSKQVPLDPEKQQDFLCFAKLMIQIVLSAQIEANSVEISNLKSIARNLQTCKTSLCSARATPAVRVRKRRPPPPRARAELSRELRCSVRDLRLLVNADACARAASSQRGGSRACMGARAELWREKPQRRGSSRAHSSAFASRARTEQLLGFRRPGPGPVQASATPSRRPRHHSQRHAQPAEVARPRARRRGRRCGQGRGCCTKSRRG
jgi:hypothetical protein